MLAGVGERRCGAVPAEQPTTANTAKRIAASWAGVGRNGEPRRSGKVMMRWFMDLSVARPRIANYWAPFRHPPHATTN
jgi:hypothetical protein